MASDKNFTKVITNFMKETSKKRSKTILNNTAGSYVYSGSRLRHALLCNDVSLCLDDSGDDKDYMLSNSSSGFGIMRPCVISMTEVGATILYFVKESTIPAEIKDAYHIGAPFVKATVATASLSTYFPTGEETTPHVLVSVPVNLPIDGGMTLTSGVVEDDVYQTLQVSHGAYGTFYLDAMVSHDVALQAAAGTHKATLKDHYPNRNATGTVVIPDSNITITYTTPDMEDTLGSELVGLQRRMPIDPGVPPAPGVGIPTNILTGADTQSGNYNTTAMLAPLTCRKQNSQTLSFPSRTPQTEMDLGLDVTPKLTADEKSTKRLHLTQCLFFMGISKDADDVPTLVLPVRSSEGELIHKAGSKAAQNAAYREGIDDTMTRIYSTSTHFLGRAADFHSNSFTDLQGALITQFRVCKFPLASLDAAAANKTSWSIAYFIPLSLTIDADVDKDNEDRIAEQVLGKEIEHLTKIKATNKINRYMDSHSMVMTFLGNCHCFPQVIWDISSVKPVFIVCVEELADTLTEPHIRRWFERACLREGGYHLPWAVFNIVEQVSILFDTCHFLKPKTHKRKLLNNHPATQVCLQLATVVKEGHISALEQHEISIIPPTFYGDCLLTVRTFCHRLGAAAKGGERIVETALYLTSAKKRQQDQIAAMKERAKMREMAATLAAAARTPKDRGRDLPGKNAPGVPDPNKKHKGQPGKHVGDIKCFDPTNPKTRIRLMALPKLTTGPQPCAPYYRDGSTCKNEDCELAHVPMCDLPDQSRKEWFDHVTTQPHLHFNMKTCKCFLDANGALNPPK